jgi:hypothetical protein
MFGEESKLPSSLPQLAADSVTYSEQLQCKLKDMYHLVELNIIHPQLLLKKLNTTLMLNLEPLSNQMITYVYQIPL